MKFIQKAAAVTLAAMLALSAAACGQKSQEPVKIATKPMTEQFILGNMLGMLIEQEGYPVEITEGIGGGTANIQPALVKGDFDLYPEYTGTGWLMVLKKTETPDDETLYRELSKAYEEQFQLKWVGQYGFNNTYTLAVRAPVAEKYGLETYSDLSKAAQDVVFGANGDFIEREDGYIGLCDTYGFSFNKVMDIDIGLKYQALANGQIDVTNAYTTDAQLSVADVKTLTDDKHFFTNYYAGTVVRADALQKYPKLETALMKMDGILTDQEMGKLNYEVDVNKRDAREVAREFLVSKGLIKE